ncbi:MULTISPECIES: hypothetical protein [Nitrosomonas]|uniref:hypothetical protein n=1 Tax=Nitrosomonas sp. GH22 TaxID=153947 RepID=UPI0003229C95|nr:MULTISPECIES: hypothetical protein [Nitrosomonas]
MQDYAGRSQGIHASSIERTLASDESLLEQLRGDAVEQRLRPCFTDPVLEGPYSGVVGHSCDGVRRRTGRA